MPPTLKENVMALLATRQGLSLTEVATALKEYKAALVCQAILRMSKEGILVRTGDGRFRLAQKLEPRTIDSDWMA
jgi:hypothetical protein